jgi:hypothetical protein
MTEAEKAAAEAAAKAESEPEGSGGEETKGPDLGYLPPETEETKPDLSAADAVKEEQRLEHDATKDDRIAFLEQQLKEEKNAGKEARKRTEAASTVREVFNDYPHASASIVREAFEQGKPANEIRRLAKVTHFAVKEVREGASSEAEIAADARASEIYGTPAQTGKTSSGELSARDFAKLPRAEQLRRIKEVRSTDKTSFT